MLDNLKVVKTSKNCTQFDLEPDGDEFLLSSSNLEGKYNVSIMHDPAVSPTHSQCFSIITDPSTGNKAKFFHQLCASEVRDDNPDFDWADRLIENFFRMRRILSFMKSLTNDQCKQMINEQKKKSI